MLPVGQLQPGISIIRQSGWVPRRADSMAFAATVTLCPLNEAPQLFQRLVGGQRRLWATGFHLRQGDCRIIQQGQRRFISGHQPPNSLFGLFKQLQPPLEGNALFDSETATLPGQATAYVFAIQPDYTTRLGRHGRERIDRTQTNLADQAARALESQLSRVEAGRQQRNDMTVAGVEAIDLAGESPAGGLDQLLLGPAQRQYRLLSIGARLGRGECGHARFACALRLPGALLLAGGSSLRL